MDTATTRSGIIAHLSERAPLIALDLARGLAAVMVMLVHVRARSFVELGALPPGQQSWPVAIFFAATRLGVEAVLLFFVLSGFLVGGRIIRRAKSSTFSLKDYGIDRCSRILLPLIPACLLTALIGHFVLGQGINLPVLTANMLGLNGVLAPTLDANLPLWSLSYEIWFYIAGGACWALTRRPLGAIVALAACSVVFSILAASLLLCWAFGALMVLALDVPRKRSLFMVGLALAAAGIAFLQLSVGSRFLAIAGIAYVSPDVSRTLLCIGASLQLPYLCSAGVDRALRRFAVPARALAAFSYTLYLIHYPVNLALDHVFTKAPEITVQSLAIFLARITICVAASLLFYFCFERHTLAVRRWLKRAMTQESCRSYPIPLWPSRSFLRAVRSVSSITEIWSSGVSARWPWHTAQASRISAAGPASSSGSAEAGCFNARVEESRSPSFGNGCRAGTSAFTQSIGGSPDASGARKLDDAGK